MEVLGIGIFAILFVILLILVVIALLVLNIIANWKIFEKAGQEGWKSIIPYYNNWVLTVDICDMHFIYFLIPIISSVVLGIVTFITGFIAGISGGSVEGVSFLVSIFSWIANIVTIAVNVAVYYNLSKKFNKDIGWVILTLFFGVITFPILAFSKKDVFTDVEVSKHSLFSSVFK